MTRRFWEDTGLIKIKICGVDSVGFAIDCYDLGVDALGFHIWEHEFLSGEWQQKVSLFSRITYVLPDDISLVLVSNIQDINKLKVFFNFCKFDTFQLHRYISPFQLADLVREIKLFQENLKIISVIAMNPKEVSGDPLELAIEYSRICDAILLDSSWKGGSGKTHDWTLSAKVVNNVACPCILAGGLNAGNIIQALQIVKPFAIDIQSGVEKKLQKSSLELKAKSVLKVEEIVRIMRESFYEEINKH